MIATPLPCNITEYKTLAICRVIFIWASNILWLHVNFILKERGQNGSFDVEGCRPSPQAFFFLFAKSRTTRVCTAGMAGMACIRYIYIWQDTRELYPSTSNVENRKNDSVKILPIILNEEVIWGDAPVC